MVYSESEWDNMDKKLINAYEAEREKAMSKVEDKNNTVVWIVKVLGKHGPVFYARKDQETQCNPKVSYPVELIYPLDSAGCRFTASCSLDNAEEYDYQKDDELIIYLKRKIDDGEEKFYRDIYKRINIRQEIEANAVFSAAFKK